MSISMITRGFSPAPPKASHVVQLVLQYKDDLEILELIHWFHETRNIKRRLDEVAFDFDGLRLLTRAPAGHPAVASLPDVPDAPLLVADRLLDDLSSRRIAVPLNQRIHITTNGNYLSYRDPTLRSPAFSQFFTPIIPLESFIRHLFLTAPAELIVKRFEAFARLAPRLMCEFLAGDLAPIGGAPRPLPAGIEPIQLEPLLSCQDPAVRERALTIVARFSKPRSSGAAGYSL